MPTNAGGSNGPHAPGWFEVHVYLVNSVEQRRLDAGQLRTSRDALAQGLHPDPKQTCEIAQFPVHADQQQRVGCGLRIAGAHDLQESEPLLPQYLAELGIAVVRGSQHACQGRAMIFFVGGAMIETQCMTHRHTRPFHELGIESAQQSVLIGSVAKIQRAIPAL